MAKAARTQLQEQIEAIRQEAFAEGYRAAMLSVRDFASRPAPSQKPARPPAAAAAPPASSPRRKLKSQPPVAKAAQAVEPNPPRGTNAKLVEAVLQSIAPRGARPSEIRNTLQREKEIALSFTSIRHALDQLAERRVAEQIADTGTWRHVILGGAPGRSG